MLVWYLAAVEKETTRARRACRSEKRSRARRLKAWPCFRCCPAGPIPMVGRFGLSL